MSDDLLAKERKFHRLNRELKTHDIMKEINSIVHTSTSTSISNELFNDAKQLHSFTMIDVKTTYPRDKTLNTQDKKSRKSSSLEASEILNIGNIADTENSSKQYNSLGNKAIIELFKSKIDMLHKKLQIIQLDYNKKCEYYKELELKTRKLGETQVKLHSRIGLLSDAIVKL
ncbi:PREDICTED: uncharacterized protein LOC106748516, partial [Dinoponera quadriceps]|uniref:Uncharacterized protein LOC106748516 n=1 Tax=Dinoponera quadriceps TaxID=609295 RepID=A0A6P3XVL8_DINQU